jgi:hypothetical protein
MGQGIRAAFALDSVWRTQDIPAQPPQTGQTPRRVGAGEVPGGMPREHCMTKRGRKQPRGG